MTDPKQMPERVWLTATASESLRDIIPYQFDHDECDTEYIRADLAPQIDVDGIMALLWHSGAFFDDLTPEEREETVRRILTEAQGGGAQAERDTPDCGVRSTPTPAAPDPHPFMKLNGRCVHLVPSPLDGGASATRCGRPADDPIHKVETARTNANEVTFARHEYIATGYPYDEMTGGWLCSVRGCARPADDPIHDVPQVTNYDLSALSGDDTTRAQSKSDDSQDVSPAYVGPGDEVEYLGRKHKVIGHSKRYDGHIVIEGVTTVTCPRVKPSQLRTPDGRPVAGFRDRPAVIRWKDLRERIAELEHALQSAQEELERETDLRITAERAYRYASDERDEYRRDAKANDEGMMEALRERDGARTARDNYMSAYQQAIDSIQAGLVGIVKSGEELCEMPKMHYYECFPKGEAVRLDDDVIERIVNKIDVHMPGISGMQVLRDYRDGKL